VFEKDSSQKKDFKGHSFSACGYGVSTEDLGEARVRKRSRSGKERETDSKGGGLPWNKSGGSR